MVGKKSLLINTWNNVYVFVPWLMSLQLYAHWEAGREDPSTDHQPLGQEGPPVVFFLMQIELTCYILTLFARSRFISLIHSTFKVFIPWLLLGGEERVGKTQMCTRHLEFSDCSFSQKVLWCLRLLEIIVRGIFLYHYGLNASESWLGKLIIIL